MSLGTIDPLLVLRDHRPFGNCRKLRPNIRCCRVYRISGRSVRTASTTCSIAALVTCESPLSYNSDSCVAPSTTRWILSDESATSSSCIASYLDDCWPALITASGLSPMPPMLRSWALVSGVARKSSTVVITCCVEVLNALICAAALVSRGAG